MVICTAQASAAPTISGNIYSSAAPTVWNGCDGSTLNVTIVVDATAYTVACTAGTGAYTKTLPANIAATNKTIVVYLNGAGPGGFSTHKGATYTLNPSVSADITSLHVYTNHVTIDNRSGTSMTDATTNGGVGHYDATNTSMIAIDSDGTNVTMPVAGDQLTTKIWVKTGTYAPGGAVDTGALRIDGTFTQGGTLTIRSGGSSIYCYAGAGSTKPFCIGGGGVYNPGSYTTKFTSTSDLLLQGTTYGSLSLGGTGTAAANYSLGNNLVVTGALDVGNANDSLPLSFSTSNYTIATGTMTVRSSAALSGDSNFTSTGSVSGAGNDTLVGGAGKDVLTGGAGNDIINARDRKPGDTISCGSGKDSVKADKGDKIARDCERRS